MRSARRRRPSARRWATRPGSASRSASSSPHGEQGRCGGGRPTARCRAPTGAEHAPERQAGHGRSRRRRSVAEAGRTRVTAGGAARGGTTPRRAMARHAGTVRVRVRVIGAGRRRVPARVDPASPSSSAAGAHVDLRAVGDRNPGLLERQGDARPATPPSRCSSATSPRAPLAAGARPVRRPAGRVVGRLPRRRRRHDRPRLAGVRPLPRRPQRRSPSPARWWCCRRWPRLVAIARVRAPSPSSPSRSPTAPGRRRSASRSLKSLFDGRSSAPPPPARSWRSSGCASGWRRGPTRPGSAVGPSPPGCAAGEVPRARRGGHGHVGERRQPVRRRRARPYGPARAHQRPEAQGQQGHVEGVGPTASPAGRAAAPGPATPRRGRPACRGGEVDVGQRQRAPPPVPRLAGRLVHAHRQQRRPRRGTRRRQPCGRQGAGERDVVDGVAGGDGPKPPAATRSAARAPCTGRWPSCRRRARRMRRRPAAPKRYTSVVSSAGCSSAAAGGGALEPAADADEVPPVGHGPRHERRRQPGRGRVSASSVTTHSPVAASRPCCSAHGLPTQPPGSGRPVTTRGAAAPRATAAVASVDSSSTTITSVDRRVRRRPRRSSGPMPRCLVAGRDDDGDRGRSRAAADEPAGRAGERGRRAPARAAAAPPATARPRRAPSPTRRPPPGRRRCGRSVAHERQPAARVARPADEVQPAAGAPVARAQERGAPAVRRRAVDRPAGRPVARRHVGRRDRLGAHAAGRAGRRRGRARTSRTRSRYRARRRARRPAGALTSRNQFSSPAGACAGVGDGRDAGVDRRVVGASGPAAELRRTRPGRRPRTTRCGGRARRRPPRRRRARRTRSSTARARRTRRRARGVGQQVGVEVLGVDVGDHDVGARRARPRPAARRCTPPSPASIAHHVGAGAQHRRRRARRRARGRRAGRPARPAGTSSRSGPRCGGCTPASRARAYGDEPGVGGVRDRPTGRGGGRAKCPAGRGRAACAAASMATRSLGRAQPAQQGDGRSHRTGEERALADVPDPPAAVRRTRRHAAPRPARTPRTRRRSRRRRRAR